MANTDPLTAASRRFAEAAQALTELPSRSDPRLVEVHGEYVEALSALHTLVARTDAEAWLRFNNLPW